MFFNQIIKWLFYYVYYSNDQKQIVENFLFLAICLEFSMSLSGILDFQQAFDLIVVELVLGICYLFLCSLYKLLRNKKLPS